jgi:hypothetical protein
MKLYLSEAIKSLRPTAEFSYTDDDYSTIKWDVLDGQAPTQSEIDSAIAKIKADEITEAKSKATEKASLLNRLGITADEAKLLLS